MYFANNSAKEAGNSVYSSLFYDNCSWLPNTAFQYAPLYEITTKTISFADQNRQQVSADPDQVCFCSQPWLPGEGIETASMNDLCSRKTMDNITKVYPGEIIDIMVVGFRIPIEYHTFTGYIAPTVMAE